MSRRIPDPVRQQVREELKAGTPWRAIKRKLKVNEHLINEVRIQAGLPKRSSPAPAATPPNPPNQAAPAGDDGPTAEEGDGLSDLQPPRKRARASPLPAAPPPASAPLARIQGCPHCKAQWELDAGEEPLESCPKCKRSVEVHQCPNCGALAVLEDGEAEPTTCPKCGRSYA